MFIEVFEFDWYYRYIVTVAGTNFRDFQILCDFPKYTGICNKMRMNYVWSYIIQLLFKISNLIIP